MNTAVADEINTQYMTTEGHVIDRCTTPGEFMELNFTQSFLILIEVNVELEYDITVIATIS